MTRINRTRTAYAERNHPRIILSIRIHSIRCTTVLRCPSLRIASASGHVHGQPDDQTRCEAYGKQEWKAMPGISSLVDDRLDHVRSDNRGTTTRQSKQAKKLHTRSKSEKAWGIARLEERTHHKVEPRWGQLGHHRLRK